MSTPLTIVAFATAVQGNEAALRAAQERLVAETVVEPGCLRYELNQSVENPTVLVFTESWVSEKHWQDHMNGAAIRRFHASGASQLIQDFTLFRLKPIAGGASTQTSQENPS